MSGSLAGLRAVIEDAGGPLAAELAGAVEAEAAIGALVAAGPRVGDRGADYGLLTESIFEGYLLHYAHSRLLEGGDRDLALLGGDFLYAFGLTRLAQLGDLDAIEDLADLITLCAQLHAPAGGDPDGDLLGALWVATALAVGSGRWEGYLQAKQLVRAGASDAGETTASSAAERAREVGLTLELDRALIVFRSPYSGELRTT